MTIIKRFVPFGLSVIFVLLVGGCHHDQKQVESIHHDLKQSAQIEKTFAENQETLGKVNRKEHNLYKTIISLNVNQTDKIQSAIKKAQKYNKKQQQALKTAKKHFKQAFTEVSSMEPVVEKINDTKQKKAASKVVELMEKRHHLYQSYNKKYSHALALNHDFYKQLAKQEYKVSELDQQIEEINHVYDDMKSLKQQFNRYTKQYNKAKIEYYQKAGLEVKSQDNSNP
ncbi:YkyA family protein [Tuberibacillus sp. Marseille-P3662]|uniref:YkyA family protein n=1 Tax=Tuberibacillus sp. Marseille-P3662 TaxID=1965358 RepID=UPI000A1C84E1|nr:YkyA family protein [Tuberibacillus sp. Marseille-P3662]